MEAIEAAEVAQNCFRDMMQGKFDGIEAKLDPLYNHMSSHVKMQKDRIGGNMAIAQAVFSRSQRIKIRKILGPDLIFIVLNMTKECTKKRIEARHGTSIPEDFVNLLVKYAEFCEPAGEDEENTYNLTISENMSKDDVVEKVLKIVNSE